MRRILVADDLTGASDAGVQFTKNGLRTVVWLDHGAPPEDEDADVVVVDMDSRAIPPDEAYARMQRLLHRLRPSRPRELVKKMDSTLRGNVGPELHALLEALPDAFAIVCPAYPKNGRAARDGILAVNGVRVDRTDFGRDLFSPVHDPRIASHLWDESVQLRLDDVRAGRERLADRVARARSDGVRVAVADAERDDDLIALAELDYGGDDILWVGSAGLIEMLERGDPGRGGEPEPGGNAALPAVREPVVFLIGSISAMTQEQLAFAGEDAAFHVALIDPLDALSGTPAFDEAVRATALALADGKDAIMALVGERPRVEAALAEAADRGWDARATGAVLRERLAATLDGLAGDGRTVVLSGGDVARAFCERRRIRGMRMLAETAPGIPMSRAIGADLFLVTKAGGFGRPETYRDIVAALHQQVTT